MHEGTQTRSAIQTIVKEYQEHLQKKLDKEGIFLQGKRFVRRDSQPLTSKQTKLTTRYETISNFNKTIKYMPILKDNDKVEAAAVLKICLNNKPDWSEQPFLRRLGDVLSIGIIPLIKTFLSKERAFEQQLDQISNSENIRPKNS